MLNLYRTSPSVDLANWLRLERSGLSWIGKPHCLLYDRLTDCWAQQKHGIPSTADQVENLKAQVAVANWQLATAAWVHDLVDKMVDDLWQDEVAPHQAAMGVCLHAGQVTPPHKGLIAASR